MNQTRTIEATFAETIRTDVETPSTEAPVDLLASKVFAATIGYVAIFITVTVVLMAL